MSWIYVTVCSALLLQTVPAHAATSISSNELRRSSSLRSIPYSEPASASGTQSTGPVVTWWSSTPSNNLGDSDNVRPSFAQSSSPASVPAPRAETFLGDNSFSSLSSGPPPTAHATDVSASSSGNSAPPTSSPALVSSASSTFSTTVTPTAVSIDPPPTPTDKSATGEVKNPQDPSESISFVRQHVPSDMQDQLPSIADGDLLPVILNIRGVQTPVVVDSTGDMVIPLGDVAAWLTPDLFPAPGSISKVDDGREDDANGDDDPSPSPSSELPSSSVSSSTLPASQSSSFPSQSKSRAAITSISIEIRYDVGTLTANTVGAASMPLNTGSLPASIKQSTSATSAKDSSPFPVQSSPSSSSPLESSSLFPSSSSSTSIAISPTLNCQQSIPSDGPRPSDVTNALHAGDLLRAACNSSFHGGSGDSTHRVFSHGELAITVIRDSSSVALTHCKEGFQAIQDTCIIQNRNYGGTYTRGNETYIIANSKYPDNPLILGEDDGATAPTPKGPPMPQATDGNNKGSSLCKNLSGACKKAYRQYVDDFLYKDETSYTARAGDADPVNWLPFADNGCAAIFRCENYNVGLTGGQIKQAVEDMFEADHVSECGSTYLDNGCHITLNGCQSCRKRIPCDAIPEGVQRYGCYH